MAQCSNQIFKASCPADWRECPRTYYQTKVSWLHDENALSADRIKYEMFKPQVMTELDSIMRDKKKEIRSLDYLSRNVSFRIHLVGPMEGILWLESEYFRFVLKDFFSSTCASTKSIVWEIDLSMHVDHNSNTTTYLHPIIASGNILGAAEASGDMLKDVQRCMEVNQKTFLVKLANDGGVNPRFGNDWEIFRSKEIALVDFKFNELQRDEIVGFDEDYHKSVGAILGIAVGAAFFVIAFGLLFRHVRNRSLRYQELQEFREARKIDRMRKRAIKRSASSMATEKSSTRSLNNDLTISSSSVANHTRSLSSISNGKPDSNLFGCTLLHVVGDSRLDRTSKLPPTPEDDSRPDQVSPTSYATSSNCQSWNPGFDAPGPETIRLPNNEEIIIAVNEET